MAGPVQHFELKMKNTTGSINFYSTVFNWDIDASGTTDHWRILESSNQIGELRQAPSQEVAAVIPFFQVNDLPGAIGRAIQMGGDLIDSGPGTPVLSHSYAVFRDVDGCLFGIYQ